MPIIILIGFLLILLITYAFKNIRFDKDGRPMVSNRANALEDAKRKIHSILDPIGTKQSLVLFNEIHRTCIEHDIKLQDAEFNGSWDDLGEKARYSFNKACEREDAARKEFLKKQDEGQRERLGWIEVKAPTSTEPPPMIRIC